MTATETIGPVALEIIAHKNEMIAELRGEIVRLEARLLNAATALDGLAREVRVSAEAAHRFLDSHASLADVEDGPNA